MSTSLSSSLASRAEARRLRLLGVVWLLVVVFLLWLSIAAYQHVFSDETTVTVEASQVGAQLNTGGDVRMNGAIVGRVVAVRPGPGGTTGGASVELAIEREAADRIPSDVTARILPTTLFGQKYVELLSDSDPTEAAVDDGARIPIDTSDETVEITDVLNRLEPLLTAVEPDDLASTLSALTTALDGRGAEIGQLINEAGPYLASLNDLAPQFIRDLELVADVSGDYADAMPSLVTVLTNGAVTAQTLADRPGDVAAFTSTTTQAAGAVEALLAASGENLARANAVARPTLEMLATYSPEIVCLLDGFYGLNRSSASSAYDNRIFGRLQFGPQTTGYTAADELAFGDAGHGPDCRGLPDPPIPYPGIVTDDGVEPRPGPAAGSTDLLSILMPTEAGAS